MFDFEKLIVYQKGKAFSIAIRAWQNNASNIDKNTENQLKRAAFSIPLNIAEGAGRFTNKDRRNFMVIARGSLFECVAIIDLLKDEKKISEKDFAVFYKLADEVSRMLLSFIKKLSQT